MPSNSRRSSASDTGRKLMPSSAAILRRETDWPIATSPRTIRRRTKVYASAARLALFAGKVGGLVDAARAFVGRDLRIGAQRPRAIDRTAFAVRRGDHRRRLALLHPLLERADLVEVVGAFTAAAMGHARRHKETEAVVDVAAGAAGDLPHLLVILDRRERRDLRVGPAVIHQQLAAAREERLEIRIARVDVAADALLELLRIAVGVELRDRPLRVVVDEVTIVIEPGRARRLRPSEIRPVQLAAVRETGDLARAALERRVDRLHRLHLGGAQAVRSVAVLALNHLRIELARLRFGHQAVL